jgi:hypothetical protein
MSLAGLANEARQKCKIQLASAAPDRWLVRDSYGIATLCRLPIHRSRLGCGTGFAAGVGYACDQPFPIGLDEIEEIGSTVV